MGRIPIHKQPNHNSNGFDKNPQNRGHGRPQDNAIKILRRLINHDVHEYQINWEHVIAMTEDTVTVQLPMDDYMVLRILLETMSQDDHVSLKAIKYLLTRIYGRKTEIPTKPEPPKITPIKSGTSGLYHYYCDKRCPFKMTIDVMDKLPTNCLID